MILKRRTFSRRHELLHENAVPLLNPKWCKRVVCKYVWYIVQKLKHKNYIAVEYISVVYLVLVHSHRLISICEIVSQAFPVCMLIVFPMPALGNVLQQLNKNRIHRKCCVKGKKRIGFETRNSVSLKAICRWTIQIYGSMGQ